MLPNTFNRIEQKAPIYEHIRVKQMKITIIADILGEENNGTTIACMNLVRYLKACGDIVSVVCCDKSKIGIAGYYVVDTYNLGPVINKMVAKNNVVLAKPDKKIIYEAIKDSDAIHIMMPFALGKAAVKIAKKLKKPVTAGFHVQAENFTSHIGMMNQKLINHLTYIHFYNKVYKKAEAIHYPTEFIRDVFEKNIHRRTSGRVISNGVNKEFILRKSEKPKEMKSKFVILFTGRYSKEKSHKILIKAVSLSKHKESIQLIFAGQGPEAAKIQNYAKKRKITLPLMQFFPRDELVKIINYSDLYCHPAEIEIEAIACIEAISCGLVPVISNSLRCATKNFAIDEKNLFRCNDAKDLAYKIDYWIEHPEEKAERSKEYLGYSSRFGQEQCMQEMRQMIIDVVNR